jgi:hypothetical protein
VTKVIRNNIRSWKERPTPSQGTMISLIFSVKRLNNLLLDFSVKNK